MKDLSAFMPEALGYPYPEEVLRAAQEAAEKLKPFYESTNFSTLQTATQIAAKMAPMIAKNNALWNATQTINALAKMPDIGLLNATRFSEDYLSALRSATELIQSQRALFDDLTASRLDVLSNLLDHRTNLRGLEGVRLTSLLDSLAGIPPSKYKRTLKLRFPIQKKRKRRRRKNIPLSGYEKINLILNLIQTLCAIIGALAALGIPLDSVNLLDLFHAMENEVQSEIRYEGHTESSHRKNCDCGVMEHDNGEARTPNDDEQPSQVHEPTSKLI